MTSQCVEKVFVRVVENNFIVLPELNRRWERQSGIVYDGPNPIERDGRSSKILCKKQRGNGCNSGLRAENGNRTLDGLDYWPGMQLQHVRHADRFFCRLCHKCDTNLDLELSPSSLRDFEWRFVNHLSAIDQTERHKRTPVSREPYLY